jgi:meso-butanediol dehydrogenase / (S,S)-butanediol dehydrogenase / diacetyl reductase
VTSRLGTDPDGVAVDTAGDVYVTDLNHHRGTALAVEYIKTSMCVNAIAPAGCNTSIAATVQLPEGMDIDLATRMAGLRGMAEPEEVAALFALASDEAPSITGAVYIIDNGLTVS